MLLFFHHISWSRWLKQKREHDRDGSVLIVAPLSDETKEMQETTTWCGVSVEGFQYMYIYG